MDANSSVAPSFTVRCSHVEAAELCDAVGHHLLQCGQVADVDLAGQHVAAGRLDCPCRLGQLIGAG
jgi:hypothetical protein